MTSCCIALKTSNSYWLTQKQCMKLLLATAYVLHFQLHSEPQTAMLNLHIMRCFSEPPAIGQMHCTGGWQLASRLVAYGFKIGSCLSSAVLVQCVKIVIPRTFQTADSAISWWHWVVFASHEFFSFCAVPCEISVCWVRSVSHDVWCECERACDDLLSVGVNAGVVKTSAVILWAVWQFSDYSIVHRKQDVELRTTTRGATRKP
jgi:hypothetical protein